MRRTSAWLRRHPFLVLLVATLTGLATLWCFSKSPRHIDMEHFQQIKAGMTGAEVEHVLGGPQGYFGVPGLPGGWLHNAWLQKARNGTVTGQGASWGDRDRGPLYTWLIVNFDRFAIIQVFVNDEGRVTGALFAQYER